MAPILRSFTGPHFPKSCFGSLPMLLKAGLGSWRDGGRWVGESVAHQGSRISEGHYHNKDSESRFQGTRRFHVPYFVRASQQVCGAEVMSLVSQGRKRRLRVGNLFKVTKREAASYRLKARRPDSQLRDFRLRKQAASGWDSGPPSRMVPKWCGLWRQQHLRPFRPPPSFFTRPPRRGEGMEGRNPRDCRQLGA